MQDITCQSDVCYRVILSVNQETPLLLGGEEALINKNRFAAQLESSGVPVPELVNIELNLIRCYLTNIFIMD